MTTAKDRIRPAVPEDAPAMAGVFAASIEAKAQSGYGPCERAAWIDCGTRERFAAMFADREVRLVVAEARSGLTGLAGLRGCEVSLVYTTPEAAPGTGARLLGAIEALAREAGLSGLTLTASRNALRFYLRHGYAILRPATRPLPGGLSLPVCLMSKELAS